MIAMNNLRRRLQKARRRAPARAAADLAEAIRDGHERIAGFAREWRCGECGEPASTHWFRNDHHLIIEA